MMTLVRALLLALFASAIAVVLFLLLQTHPTLSPFPMLQIPVSQGESTPELTAKSVFIVDPDSQTVLYEKQADLRIYPASTTKMMTALVAKDYFPLDQKITVTVAYPEGQDAGFQPGEVVTAENLLYALLVNSANDAAEILAENYEGGRIGFVAAMNARVESLGLRNTHFKNPTGLDEEGHYSTTADLSRIAQELIRHSYLSRIVSTEAAVINSSDYTRAHPVTNINELLGHVEGVVGIKTGFTDLAGQTLITLVDRNHHRVLIVVSGSTDRFGETRALIDWIYTNFVWQ